MTLVRSPMRFLVGYPYTFSCCKRLWMLVRLLVAPHVVLVCGKPDLKAEYS